MLKLNILDRLIVTELKKLAGIYNQALITVLYQYFFKIKLSWWTIKFYISQLWCKICDNYLKYDFQGFKCNVRTANYVLSFWFVEIQQQEKIA